MKENEFYKEFAVHFKNCTTQELVDNFNSQVGNRGWVGIRAYYDAALVDELASRGVNLSGIVDGNTIRFDRKINL